VAKQNIADVSMRDRKKEDRKYALRGERKSRGNECLVASGKIRHDSPSRTHRTIGSRESTRGEQRRAEGESLKQASFLDSVPSVCTVLFPSLLRVFNYSVIFSRRREVERLGGSKRGSYGTILAEVLCRAS